MNNWISIAESNLGNGRYLTCILENGVERNVQKLSKQGNLWFTADGCYIYYTPTHYKLQAGSTCN